MWQGRSKWYDIGLELGLLAGDLDATEKSDPGVCLTIMLKKWLRSDRSPSWHSLATALRAKPVGLEQLAKTIDPDSESVGETK